MEATELTSTYDSPTLEFDRYGNLQFSMRSGSGSGGCAGGKVFSIAALDRRASHTTIRASITSHLREDLAYRHERKSI